MSKKRIGILTSGGDCPGLNAVIRGAVKASHQMGYDCVGFLKGYEGLYDPVQYVHLTPDSTRGILNQGGTILGSTNKGRFAATVGVDNRKEIEPHLIEGVKGTIDQLGIDGLICVGGDGSLAVAQQFHEQGIPVVGVPKTIDNDLSATAFTFGFDSAIECATDALDRLHTTAASHERIMVLEVMGRHAGWIALHSGIAGGGDIILLPEIGWTWDHVCHKIMHRESQGKKYTLVVVAEGAELPGGDLVGEQRDGQQMKLGGIGRAVTEEIERRLHRETRLSVLGHLQRGGAPTTFDRVLATQFGAHAVRLVHEGRFGEMICSRPPEMTSVPIMEAVNVLRRVDPHGPAVQAARALGISFGDRAADELGNNVFDRLEPVSHVADLVEEQAGPVETLSEPVETPVEPVEAPAQVVETPAEVAAVAGEAPVMAEGDTPIIIITPETPQAESETEAEEQEQTETEILEQEPSETEAMKLNCQRELTDSPEEEAAPQDEPAAAADGLEAAAEVAEPVATEPEPTEDDAVEAVAETMLDLVAEADEAIHGDPVAEEAEEEAAADPEETDTPVETPAEEEPALPEQPETDVAVEPEPTVEEPEPVVEEPVATVEEIDKTVHEVAALLPEETTNEPAPEVAVAESSAEEPSGQDEPVELAVTTPLEADEPVAEAAAAVELPDFSEAQAQLAERIADAAKQTREAADVEPVAATETPAAAEPAPAMAEAPQPSAADDLAERVRQRLAAAQAVETSLEEPADNPHGEDLVAEARSALEEALAD